MLTGFAVTTVVGVLIGIFITRPVFADYMETFLVKNPREEINISKSSESKPKKNKKKGRKTIAREEAEKAKKRR